jgi:hypothetical protein
VEKAQQVLDALASVSGLVSSFQSTDEISFIPESPYIRVVIESRDIIINAMDGKVVFNSGTAAYRILQSQFLPEVSEFLLLASDGKVFYYVLWNLKTGEEVWKTELGSVDSFLSMFKNLFSLKNSSTHDKSELFGDAIYTSVSGILYKLDKASGKVLWQSKDKINNFYLSQTGNNVIIVKNTGGLLSAKQALNIWSSKDGEAVWKEDLKTKYIIYLEDWSDRLLVAHNSGFNFYNYADGKKIWKKDAKGNNIKQVIPIDHDYLYIADKEMNLINQEGLSKWKKFVEICDNDDDPVYFLDMIGDNQVVYLTGTYGNLVDYTSGKKIWKKNLEFDEDRSVLYAMDEATNTFMVYNDKNVYKFDSKTTERPDPLVKLKKINNEKSIADIELFDWGISLIGEGDAIGVGLDGVVKYQNTYTEPGGGTRKFLKGAGTALAIGGAAASSISQAEIIFYSKNADGEWIETGRASFNDKIKRAGRRAGAAAEIISSDLLPLVNKRFAAMKANNEYAFILSKEVNGPVLVKVRKADGVEVDKIDIDNNKPIYEVDPVSDNIYYVYKNELRTYSGK